MVFLRVSRDFESLTGMQNDYYSFFAPKKNFCGTKKENIIFLP